MSSACNSLALAGVALAIACPSVAHAQASAHAMVVAGHAGHIGGGTFDCATSGPMPRELAFFNRGIGLPTEGYSYCGLAGGIQDLTGATRSGLAHQDVTWAFNKGVAVLSASAEAEIGVLGVKASGANTATSSGGFDYAAAEGAAYFSDSVTYDGDGTQLIRFTFAFDGSAQVTGTGGQAVTLFNYKIGNDPIYAGISAGVSGEGNIGSVRNPFGFAGDPIPGFTVGPGSYGGDGKFTVQAQITRGQSIDMAFGLYALAYPGWSNGTANNDFFSTARLVGINFVDAAGNILPDAVRGIGTSGYFYDNTGAHAAIAAIPEPASWAFVILGFALVGAATRRRPRLPISYGTI